MSENIKAEKPAKDDQQQFWRMAIETWQASGLSVRQFCKQEGLQEPAFYIWRKKLTGSDTESENLDTSPFIEVSMPWSNPTVVELLMTSGNTLRIDADGQNWPDHHAAKAYKCHENTVRKVRQRFVEHGLEIALERKIQQEPSRKRVIGGEKEARLISIACSQPPEGRAKWTVQMLADELVILKVV